MNEEKAGTPHDPAPTGGATGSADARRTKPPKAKLSWKERAKRAWRLTKIASLLATGGALGWAVASLQGEAALGQAQKRCEERLAAEKELAQPLELRERALLARRAMHQSVSALDQRNFGDAERHGRQAGKLLAELGPMADRYADLASELQGFRPLVSDDVSEQRRQLLSAAQRFDQIFDGAP